MPDIILIETTVPSYYVARPSRNVVQSARQELTRRWWDFYRANFEFHTSQVVLEEAGEGEALMAQAHLDLLSGVPLLDISEQVADMAQELVQSLILPSVAARDALHIAAAAVHQMRFLLTWNCQHIANPYIQERIRTCFSLHHIELPVICTPDEFIGDEDINPGD